MQILKNTGEYEEFDREKLRDSLLRASASLLVTNDVISKVESRLKEGMTTSEIYRIAFVFLKKKEKRTALRYSMKRSLLEFGPTGFPFEKFVAEIFRAKGYTAMVSTMLPGKCVDHEVDVVAYNDTDLVLIEVKFHNSINVKTDTKTALYVKARWDDLKDKELRISSNKQMLPTRGILITNTKFTRNAEKYARCADLGMISWSYPQKGNLYELVHDTGLHPVTTIDSLSNNQIKTLIDNDIITANKICKDPHVLKNIGITGIKAKKVIQEAKLVCSGD
jgi:Holliday junction resolvase-like predicted endonuclease